MLLLAQNSVQYLLITLKIKSKILCDLAIGISELYFLLISPLTVLFQPNWPPSRFSNWNMPVYLGLHNLEYPPLRYVRHFLPDLNYSCSENFPSQLHLKQHPQHTLQHMLLSKTSPQP